MKRNRIVATSVASTITLALALTACGTGSSGDGATGDGNGDGGDTELVLWLAGPDTPDELRDYLKDTFEAENEGATLRIVQQEWNDLVTALTTALPDANNTPDVVEIGNTQAGTFTGIGAFRDLTPIYEELGGDNLLPSFVEAGKVGDQNFALPYYFGSRYVFFRPDIWDAEGVEVPETLGELNEAVAALQTSDRSGFAMGGQDWRNGISWIFAHDGELATVDGDGTWTSTLADPNSVAGLEQWQELYETASNIPTTEQDVAYWEFLNDGTDGSPAPAATIMAPGWARWSIGDLVENDEGEEVRDGMADDSKFDIFALPGVDGGLAPVFAGGSNIAISAQSQNPELAENLLRIIFSEEYQTMLGENGLGPANSEYVDALGTDKFARTAIETAAASKLTPAAPGWAAVEGSRVLEEFFQKIAEGGDVAALAAEYDQKITPMLNGNG